MRLLAAAVALAALIAAGIVAAVRNGGSVPAARPAGAMRANLWVARAAGSCTRAARPARYVAASACDSGRAAFRAARAGDVIAVVDRPGGDDYGTLVLDALDKRVTIRAASGRPEFGASIVACGACTIAGLKFENRGGPTVSEIGVCVDPPPRGRGLNGQLFANGIVTACGRDLTMDHVEIDGLRDAGSPGRCPREGIVHGGPGFTFRNGLIHGVYDRKGMDVYAPRITVENTTFRDIRVRNHCEADVHNECVYIPLAEGSVWRNNRFLECPTMGLFFSGDADTDSDHVTIEGNLFTHTLNDGDEWQISPCGLAIGAGPSRIEGWVVRYNTFETVPCVTDLPPGATPGQWYGNLGGAGCIHGFVFHHNVGETCGGADSVALDPFVDSVERPRALAGLVDAPRGDFRLTADAPANGAGDPRSFPARDLRGVRRSSPPDAGAYERPG